MSPIHAPQAAGQSWKPAKSENRPASRIPSDKPRSSDQEMMYAWSIGITQAARALMEQPRENACPPEVYIG